MHTFHLNELRLEKYFRDYCRDMGMNHADWSVDIYKTPPVMMEGTSPKRLTMACRHMTTHKTLTFNLSFCGGKRGKGWVTL